MRVHALDGRVIELLVRAEELEPTIATLREHAWGRGMVSANATLDLQPRVR